MDRLRSLFEAVQSHVILIFIEVCFAIAVLRELHPNLKEEIVEWCKNLMGG